MAVYLDGIKGEYVGRRIALVCNPFRIGRSTQNDLRLKALNISRQHAIIFYENEKYLLQDCSSRIGTQVNEERVQSIILHNRDLITIGENKFRFVIPDPPCLSIKQSPEEKPKNPNILFLIFSVIFIVTAFLIGMQIINRNNKVRAVETINANETIQANATELARSEVSATAESEATLEYDSEAEYSTRTVFNSSKTISIVEDNSNSQIEEEMLGVVGNYILEMTVTNPNDVSNGLDYGILFSDLERGDQYLLAFVNFTVSNNYFKEILFSDATSVEGGSWALLRRASVEDGYGLVHSGSISNFHNQGSAANSIKYIAYNDEGSLYVNGDFIAKMDLVDWSNSGIVYICTDIFHNNGKSGNIIQFDSIILKEILN